MNRPPKEIVHRFELMLETLERSPTLFTKTKQINPVALDGMQIIEARVDSGIKNLKLILAYKNDVSFFLVSIDGDLFGLNKNDRPSLVETKRHQIKGAIKPLP